MFKLNFAFALLMIISLSGCATVAVTGAVVGGAATATKYAVKGTVGAGKLVYKGTKAAAKGTASLFRDDEVQPDLAEDSANLPPVDDKVIWAVNSHVGKNGNRENTVC